MAERSLEALKREARALELRVEGKLNEYSRLEGGAAGADVESGPDAAEATEREHARDIEDGMQQLADTTALMARVVAEHPSRTDSAMVKRFSEVVHDFKTTFRKQQASVRQRREKAALFRGLREAKAAAAAAAGGAGAETLLRERGSLVTSTRAMDEILAQAAETSEALARQRAGLLASAASVGDLFSRLPVVGGYIDGLRGQRIVSDRALALTLAVVICFFLWFLILRHL